MISTFIHQLYLHLTSFQPNNPRTETYQQSGSHMTAIHRLPTRHFGSLSGHCRCRRVLSWILNGHQSSSITLHISSEAVKQYVAHGTLNYRTKWDVLMIMCSEIRRACEEVQCGTQHNWPERYRHREAQEREQCFEPQERASPSRHRSSSERLQTTRWRNRPVTFSC